MSKKLTCPECQGTSMYTDTAGWFSCSACSKANGKPFHVAKNPKAKPEKLKGNDFKFVNLSLTDGMKNDAKLYVQNDFNFYSALEELVEDGYKVSFSVNLDNETAQCTITASYVGMSNSGKMLTGFAPDLNGALGMAYYKHTILLEKDWSKGMADNMEKDKWG